MVQLGAYHAFDNGWSASLDAMWVEFSRFGLTEVSVDGQDLHAADSAFNDFWVLTAGLAFPLTPKMEGRDLVSKVSVASPFSQSGENAQRSAVVLDFGVKQEAA